jgi:Na+/H+-dicarboxylate symporter
MTAALIDTGALAKVAYISLLAGVVVAVVFSLAVLGATRSSDMRRDGRQAAATAYAALAVLAATAAAGIVVYGLVLMAHKS